MCWVFFNLSIIVSYTHLFIAHNFNHNLIILLIGLVFFFINRNKFIQIRNIFLVFSLLFIALVIAKTNEDFGYYHLPNSLQFAQQKLQFGLGNLNHGFKHISSIFMLMSINYLPFFEYKLFNITNFLFLVFLIYFLLREIYSKSSYNLNISTFYLSVFLVLFLSKFSRLAEFGSDISGQIVILIAFFYIFEFTFNKNNNIPKIDYLKLSVIMIVFSITLKFISIIYSLFFFDYFYSFNKKRNIFKIVKKELFVNSTFTINYFFYFKFFLLQDV